MRKNNLAVVVKEAVHNSARSVARQAVSACEDLKANDTLVLDVQGLSDVADYFIVTSGNSDRHVQGIANRVMLELAKLGIEPLSIEGLEDGQWVLIDYGDVLVQVFYEPQRDYYDLESLWMRAKRVDLGHHGMRAA